MKNTVNELKPREKEAILNIIRNGIANGKDKKTILSETCKKMIAIGLVENSGAYNQMLSVAIALYNMEKARQEGKKPYEMIAQYATFKKATYCKLNDYGAFGDLIETVCRIACKPRTLVSFNDLHVKRQGNVDITIKNIPFEIGTNGKTFLESTEENSTAGRYQMIAYGVFDNDEKNLIFNLFINGQIEKGIETVANMMYTFSKQTFIETMENTGRSPMFQFKPSAGHWQVIYNGSKHTAFLKAVESQNIETLADYLKK